jgi:hypothetical protein
MGNDWHYYVSMTAVFAVEVATWVQLNLFFCHKDSLFGGSKYREICKCVCRSLCSDVRDWDLSGGSCLSVQNLFACELLSLVVGVQSRSDLASRADRSVLRSRWIASDSVNRFLAYLASSFGISVSITSCRE